MTDLADLVAEASEPSSNVALVSSRAAVASVALHHALGGKGLRLLNRRKPVAMVVAVPSSQWVDPIKATLRGINPRIKFIDGHEKPKARETEGSQASEHIARGECVVGISEASDRLLPDILLSVATHRYKVSQVTPAIVAAAMKRCLTGRLPAPFWRLDLSSLDFDLLCACMPRGSTKAAAVERLARMSATSSSPQTSTELILPALEDAVEYGDARSWGLDLKADMAALRAQKISWREVDRGCVLEGPPGSGKTTFARILGKACDLRVVMGSVSELFASSAGYLDSVIKAQRKLFETAAATAPCILFLDELNALPDPGTISPRGKDWWLPIIYDFYLLLDSAMSSREGIIVVGATNRIEDISPALLRPGRLERAIHVGIPNVEGLANILRTHLGDDLRDLDLLPVAKAGIGATAAVAMDWVRAARRTSRRAGRSMTAEDLTQQVLPSDTRSEQDLYRAAIHEAAHAIIGSVLGKTIVEVSIVGRNGSGGETQFGPHQSVHFDQATVENDVIVILAARAAEIEILGSASSGAGGDIDSDLAKATALLAALRTSFGMDDNLLWQTTPILSPALLARDLSLRTEIYQDLHRLNLAAKTLVREHRAPILTLADDLLRARSIAGETVANYLRLPR